MSSYPKWKFHHGEGAKIVHSPAEEAALGSGWLEGNQVDATKLGKAQAHALKSMTPPVQPGVIKVVMQPKEIKPKPVAKKAKAKRVR